MTPDLEPRHRDLLESLLAQPTAPFREGRVRAWAEGILKAAGVPHFRDPVGNLVVGAGSKADYLRLLARPGREPVRVFIAHMDHPGFHGVRWLTPTVLEVRWHGGSPTRHLRGAPVWLATEAGWAGQGVMHAARLEAGGRAIASAQIHLRGAPPSRPAARAVFGGFDFRRPVWRSGGRLHTRAADDLVGVFCIVATAVETFAQRGRAPFLGLLTRAEEVGLVGAVAHFELGWLARAARPVVCVSLEASRTLPGAEVGKGVIVRLGDRRTPFDANGAQVLTRLAEEVLPGRHQRRVMDGGSCEGSAATAWGFPTIALAVPLGNYHNQGLEGGPDCRGRLGPAPEFVHLGDVEGQRRLCAALLRPGLEWRDPWGPVRDRLRRNLQDYRTRLRQGG